MKQVEDTLGMAAEDAVSLASRFGKEACCELEQEHRTAMGQFLTPSDAAGFLARLFDRFEGDVRLLDPGAGVGSLTAAFVQEMVGRPERPRSLHLTVWECEQHFIGRLEEVLNTCVEIGRAAGVPTQYSLNRGDFLKDGADQLEESFFSSPQRARMFTHAILNPPYRKIQASSQARVLLRRLGLETSNLYTGFLWVAARLLEAEGEMVSITPRSFCNGPYFLPFRERFFEAVSLQRLHVFDRRDKVFSSDDVLQENIVMHARRSARKPERIMLSSSDNISSSTQRSRMVPYCRVIDSADESHVIHLALNDADDSVKAAVMGMPATLDDLGVGVSTGRVVDFRAKEFLRKDVEPKCVPLIYPLHFNGGGVHWPAPTSRKANALVAVPETEDLVVENGIYVLVKRFTAKEERRRVVATVFRPDGCLAEYATIGFENHLNYFHCKGGPMDARMAEGLAVYLNSTIVDSYFRQFSGHTQVNATDLRSLRYPSREQLRVLATEGQHNQTAIDRAVEQMIRSPRP